MNPLDAFAEETAMLAALGILLDDPCPRVYRLRLDLFSQVQVVEWAGLGIVVGSKRVAYYGPVTLKELQEVEAEATRYRDSFC
jgi:hypothetical protein